MRTSFESTFALLLAVATGPALAIGIEGANQHVAATKHCFGRRATVVGTEETEVLRGTRGDDVISGLSGRDTIYAGRGSDLICAGTGSDRVLGGGAIVNAEGLRLR